MRLMQVVTRRGLCPQRVSDPCAVTIMQTFSRTSRRPGGGTHLIAGSAHGGHNKLCIGRVFRLTECPILRPGPPASSGNAALSGRHRAITNARDAGTVAARGGERWAPTDKFPGNVGEAW
jgi:hypothetical protein